MFAPPDPVTNLPGNLASLNAPISTQAAEAELIGQCRNGRQDAWDVLFDRYYATVARFVFQLSGEFSHEDTEEICQETFLAVVRNLKSFQARSSFQTWLLRIAANKAMDFRQKTQAAKRGGNSTHLSVHGSGDDEEPPVDPPSLRPGPDAALQQAETCRLLRRALDELGDPCREIIELRYYGDLSYAEIATELHLNAKTVSSRLSKCLDRMATVAKEILPMEHSFAV